MAGTGSNYVLEKGFKVLSTYNSSAAAGVTKFRCVAFGAGGTIDLNATASTMTIGIVQEDIDQAKVTTGSAVANVRMAGISRVFVADATSLALGSRVMPGTGGGVLLAATATNHAVGIIVGAPTTISNGDIVHVFLTIGTVAA